MKAIILTALINAPVRSLVDLAGAYIICADAGLDIAESENIRPDIIMGDFDSLKSELPTDIDVITVPSHKDETDTDLALEHAFEMGAEKAVIVGGLGGRLDHTIANIQNMVRYQKMGLNVELIDDGNEIYILDSNLNPSMTISKRDNWKFSVFAFGGPAVTDISGAEYTLQGYTLLPDVPLGVSNEFTAPESTVSVTKGTCLLILSRSGKR